MVAKVEGGGDGGDDAGGECGGRQRLVGGELDDRELVTPQPRHRIAVAHAVSEALAHGFEQRVPAGMAERGIDHLEAIEIEAQHGEPLLPPRSQRGALQALAQQQAIGQLC
jgi:hypothetical protein